MAKSSTNAKFKEGALYEIHWRDAVFYQAMHDVNMKDFKDGGEILISTGYLLKANDKSILLVAELHADRTPSRDVNLIPRCLIAKAIRIKG